MTVVPEIERRRHQRHYFSKSCWCEDERITMLARIANISRGGLFLKTSNPFPIGDQAVLTFKITDYGEIIARVEIVWHSKGHYILHRPSLSGMGTKIIDIIKGGDIFKMFFSYLR